jgi:hypothetical protein
MSEKIIASNYLRGHSEILSDIAESLKNIAAGILDDHGGIGDCGDLRAKDIFANAGFLEYIADYMLKHAEDEEVKNEKT